MSPAIAPAVYERRSFPVLGVPVDAVQIQDAITRIEEWVAARNGCHYVAVADMHVITEAQHDPTFKHILTSADLVVPDGMPLVWLGRLYGHRLSRRVNGPELMLTFFETTSQKGYRHFLYGGAPGIPERLADILHRRFPGAVVTGTYSPPFRKLTTEEDLQVMEMIRQANPDVVWVGLGAPKQERWMHEHQDGLDVPVLVGVGAAFDINSGAKRQAPMWMREHGLEWLFRLLQEPRRLWHRYLVHGPQFVYWVMLDIINRKRHP